MGAAITCRREQKLRAAEGRSQRGSSQSCVRCRGISARTAFVTASPKHVLVEDASRDSAPSVRRVAMIILARQSALRRDLSARRTFGGATEL